MAKNSGLAVRLGELGGYWNVDNFHSACSVYLMSTFSPSLFYRHSQSGLPFCGVEMWRGGVGAAYQLPALSFAGASLASPCFRFHIPLIEPDGPISGIRLSEKVSRCRPREIARPLGKTDEAQHFMQGCLRKPFGRRPYQLVLGTQPLKQPIAGVLIHRLIGRADWP